jgi:hypothetical protein
MALSYAYRVLLAGFLPAIAIFLYIEGQDYDPALIRFDQIHSDKAQLTRLLPEKIEGYSLLGNVRLYTRDNLYEYVNGHAEYFISAGFISLAVGEYNATTVSSTEPDVIIDIYDMGKSIQADLRDLNHLPVLHSQAGNTISNCLHTMNKYRLRRSQSRLPVL